MQSGLESLVAKLRIKAVVARQGSAFCLYFMDHCPKDWHDLAENHQFAFDEQMRRELIARQIYCFPLATKQCSISFAHTREDIETTLQQVEVVLQLTKRS
jgi:glutamate-1-semialdehyde 2,1-aminomutase